MFCLFLQKLNANQGAKGAFSVTAARNRANRVKIRPAGHITVPPGGSLYSSYYKYRGSLNVAGDYFVCVRQCHYPVTEYVPLVELMIAAGEIHIDEIFVIHRHRAHLIVA